MHAASRGLALNPCCFDINASACEYALENCLMIKLSRRG